MQFPSLALIPALIVLCALLATPAAAAEEVERPGHEDLLLSNTRQLIFEGRRSGEGYFSADGTKMVFQSERQTDNPFYQIYLMNLETGDTRRVSTGTGKTTCAWFHPGGERVLFASTHEDPEAVKKQEEEIEKRAAGRGSRYSWSFDEHYEIYEADRDGKILRRLTNAPGYDAEGSWSPDGTSIVFASNRHAYAEELSEEERKIFKNDQSYFMDLYLMDADGSDVRRLTNTPGYDGGPFFGADGSRVVWRRFDEKGVTAEIWTMKPDGSDQRQVTRMGVMSWAPFFHPSGDYIIFANNAHGFGNFELYIVDAAGEGEPVRVTDSEGFDGLPVFTPEGERLAWASSRTADKKAQIFIADWNDAAARELLGLGSEGSVPSSASTATEQPPLEKTSPEITEDDLRLHVSTLAAEQMAGRLTGTAGARLATEYVAKAMAAAGLHPAGDMGGWFQRYGFTSGVTLEDGNRLALIREGQERALSVDQDWRPLAFSGSGSIEPGDVVFAGYGILAPGEADFPAYDSYKGLEVADKWVLVFRYLPEDVQPEHRQYLHEYADLRFKAMVARDKGARGLILVSGPSSQVKEQLVPLKSEAGAGGGSLPVVSVTDSVAEQLLAGAGKELAAAQAALDTGDPQPGFVLPGVRISADISLKKQGAGDRNVLGRLYAGDGPVDSLVIIGAHVDHIGRGTDMSSRDEDADAGKVHPGADDNASGVAALLEIAQELAHKKASGRLALKQDILFAAWTGEELGRLGSAHFVKTFAAQEGGKGLASPVMAYLNMDMVGRLDKQLYVQAVGSSPIWRSELERRNAPVGLPLRLQEDSYLPTDTMSFYLQGIPVLTAFTGTHADYNTTRDTADRLNYEGLGKIARLMGLMTRSLAMREEAPDYLAQEKPDTDASRANLRAYLGTIPDYSESDLKGVLINGVAKGAPAEQGGMQAGDIIIAVAGRTIENIYDYTYALNALKVGQPAQIRVLRQGTPIELEVTPGSRE
ncbi:MAG: M28 family peptidase [Pseudomonadota bacterium]|nr:M28 family peptidase [Pseudomonadota bacterium]